MNRSGLALSAWLGLSVWLGLLAGCGGSTSHDVDAATPDAATPDAATPDAGDAGCTSDNDCDDGLFCNGQERCPPDDPSADSLGCVAATSPCLEAQTCDEEAARCVTDCAIHGDADSDGHDSIDCGGDDCDDSDPDRYPGNTEVCDASKHDEDCDATTFGFRDADSDGFPDADCCNVDAASADVCGNDCQDAMPRVHPTEGESCNGVDDNCDGRIDEGFALVSYHPDCDGDLYGAVGTMGLTGCTPPATDPPCSAPDAASTWAPNDTDCDDQNSHVNYGTSEDACNGIDDNCDGVLSPVEDADRDGSANVGCGGTDCNDDDPTIYPGAPELCDRVDNACSLVADPGGVDPSEDTDDDGHSPIDATCAGGFPADDCDDGDAASYPGHAEVCDGADNDCDGSVDAEPDATLSCALAHTVTAICSAGECVATECGAGFGDCDANHTNGCEDDLTADGLHCGSCDVACGIECRSERCDEVVELALGSDFICAREVSGAVVCLGHNNYGQLGDGTTTDRSFPAPVLGLTDAVEIEAGLTHACARRASGEVLCWGRNNYGQLGDGTTTNRHVPTLVPGLDAVELSARYTHTCARRASGEVSCWGRNSYGQLGDGTTTDRHVPTPVVGLTDAAEIAVGGGHSCARRTSGAVTCWGDNFYHQLGDGGTTSSTLPVDVIGLTDAVELTAGTSHACVRRPSGAVVCWGSNSMRQLGDGTGFVRTLPVDVVGLTDAVQVQTKTSHTCARRVSGAVVCWGYNAYGQIGDGTFVTRDAPTAVTGLTDAILIGVGGSHSCSVRTSGQIQCWGWNRFGQLGDGGTTDSSVPVNLVPM